MKISNKLLILICVLLVILSLTIASNSTFTGTDNKATDQIQALDKNYKPWVRSIWKPPSAEVESFLFAMQAAIGAFYIGYYIGRKKNVKEHNGSFKDE